MDLFPASGFCSNAILNKTATPVALVISDMSYIFCYAVSPYWHVGHVRVGFLFCSQCPPHLEPLNEFMRGTYQERNPLLEILNRENHSKRVLPLPRTGFVSSFPGQFIIKAPWKVFPDRYAVGVSHY